MKKQIAMWILKNILKPVIKIILIEFGKIITKYFLDTLKQKMDNWKNNEAENATTEDEKKKIIVKWDERINDIEDLKGKVDIDIDKMAEEALKNSEVKIKEIENKTDIKIIEPNITPQLNSGNKSSNDSPNIGKSENNKKK